jgi:hypothetical protein
MTGTIIDHPLVRDYLREVDVALRVLPAVQARELREQITGHLDDELPPDADDEEIAEAISRLGPPGRLAAEALAGGSGAAPGTDAPVTAGTARSRRPATRSRAPRRSAPGRARASSWRSTTTRA